MCVLCEYCVSVMSVCCDYDDIIVYLLSWYGVVIM